MDEAIEYLPASVPGGIDLGCVRCESALRAADLSDICPKCGLETRKSMAFVKRAGWIGLHSLQRGALLIASNYLLCVIATIFDKNQQLSAKIYVYWVAIGMAGMVLLKMGVSRLIRGKPILERWRVVIFICQSYPLVNYVLTVGWLILWMLQESGTISVRIAGCFWVILLGARLIECLAGLIFFIAGFAFLYDLGKRLGRGWMTPMAGVILLMACMYECFGVVANVLFAITQMETLLPQLFKGAGNVASNVWTMPVFAWMMRYGQQVNYSCIAVFWGWMWVILRRIRLMGRI